MSEFPKLTSIARFLLLDTWRRQTTRHDLERMPGRKNIAMKLIWDGYIEIVPNHVPTRKEPTDLRLTDRGKEWIGTVLAPHKAPFA